MTPRAQRESNILSKEIEELQEQYNEVHAELMSKYKAHQQLIADEKAYFQEVDKIEDEIILKQLNWIKYILKDYFPESKTR
jgi:flagellar hook-length control protein FliK